MIPSKAKVSFPIKLADSSASGWADTRHLKPENFIFLQHVDRKNGIGA
jgi:hypothetical protein